MYREPRWFSSLCLLFLVFFHSSFLVFYLLDVYEKSNGTNKKHTKQTTRTFGHVRKLENCKRNISQKSQCFFVLLSVFFLWFDLFPKQRLRRIRGPSLILKIGSCDGGFGSVIVASRCLPLLLPPADPCVVALGSVFVASRCLQLLLPPAGPCVVALGCVLVASRCLPFFC